MIPHDMLYCMQEKDLVSPIVLDTLNNVMSCGELPTLYTNDEMEGLLHVSVVTDIYNIGSD